MLRGGGSLEFGVCADGSDFSKEDGKERSSSQYFDGLKSQIEFSSLRKARKNCLRPPVLLRWILLPTFFLKELPFCRLIQIQMIKKIKISSYRFL